MTVIPKTYEELKKWLDEDCNIKLEDYPKQLLDLAGYPYWRCTNWEELSEAMRHCTVPKIGDAMFSSKGLEFVEIYDDWICNNEDYRWDLIPEELIKEFGEDFLKNVDEELGLNESDYYDSSTSTVKKEENE